MSFEDKDKHNALEFTKKVQAALKTNGGFLVSSPFLDNL